MLALMPSDEYAVFDRVGTRFDPNEVEMPSDWHYSAKELARMNRDMHELARLFDTSDGVVRTQGWRLRMTDPEARRFLAGFLSPRRGWSCYGSLKGLEGAITSGPSGWRFFGSRSSIVDDAKHRVQTVRSQYRNGETWDEILVVTETTTTSKPRTLRIDVMLRQKSASRTWAKLILSG